MSHNHVPNLYDVALTVYQDVVYEAENDGAQRSDLFDQASEILQAQYDHGLMDVDVPKAIRAALLDADSKEAARADKIMDDLRKGISMIQLEGDPIYRTVTRLGKGLRKAWEYVTAVDIVRMDGERDKNYDTQTQARKRWKDNMAYVLPIVQQYGTVGDAIRAGAFDAGSEAVA